jgi:hypothetical protein
MSSNSSLASEETNTHSLPALYRYDRTRSRKFKDMIQKL